MNRPVINCPAARDLRKRITDNEYEVVCGIIYRETLSGRDTYQGFCIVPEHCSGDCYLSCEVWRNECDRKWKDKLRKMGCDKFEKIHVGS